MSFKREGDDKSQLATLRNRRIKELFADDIPEDEAMLMSNGRFACIVCGHRPVFDTVNMLYVHRQGKKHINNLQYFQQKKRELEILIEKRKHEQFLKDGTFDIQQAQTSHKGLGCGAPYDSRSKKHKPNQRKTRVDLKNDTEELSPPESQTLSGGRCCFTYLPTGVKNTSEKTGKDKAEDSSGNIKDNKTFRDMLLDQQRDGPIKHSHQLKKIFEVPSREETCRIKPYISKNEKGRELCESQSAQNDSRKKGRELFESQSAQNDTRNTSKVNQMIRPGDMKNQALSNKQFNVHENLVSKDSVKINKNRKVTMTKEKATNSTNDKPSQSDLDSQHSGDLEAKRIKAEQYLFYRARGWKKDLMGNWVKDEDAEFESDEEPPDLP